MGKAIKTEHAGGKNGGGYWGTRVVAKAKSKKLRRRQGRQAAAGGETAGRTGQPQG